MAIVHAPDVNLYQQEGGALTADTGALRATLAPDLSSAHLLKVESQGYPLYYGTGDVTYVDTAGRHQVLSAVAPAPVEVVNGNIARYAPTMAPYVVEYEVQGNRVKRRVIITAPLPEPDPEVFPDLETVYLAVHGPIRVAPAQVRIEGKPFTDNMWTAGEIELLNPAGNVVQYLERVWAESARGHVCAGRYRLVQDPLTGDLQIYELMPYWWLRTLTADDYPLTVDPNVATTTSGTATAYPNQRKVARFSNGVLFAPFNDGTNLVCRYSADNGATWQTPASGATIGAYSAASVFIDEDDYIHVVAGYGSSISYVRGTPNSERTTYTWSSVTNLYGTNVSYNFVPDVVAHREGTGWVAHVVWAYANSSGADFSVPYERLTITSGGVVTKGGTSVLWSYLVGGDAAIEYPSVAIDGAKNLYVTWNTGKTGTGNGIRFRKATYSSGSWTWGTTEAVTEAVYGTGVCAIDNSGRAYAIFQGNDLTLRVHRRASAGGWTDLSPSPSLTVGAMGATVNPENGNVFVFYPGSNKLWLVKWDTSWGSPIEVDATTSVYPSARRDTSGSAVDILYTTGSGSPYTVKSYRLSLNQPPQAPTLSVPSAFHTPSGLTLTVTHSDPDGGNMTGVYVKVGAQWWNGSALVGSEPGTPIAVSPAAASTTITIPGANFTATQTYQISAATVDPSGAKGPHNTTPAVTKASTKPTYSQSSPASGATVNTSKTRVQGAMNCGSGATPKQYVVRQYAADGSTVLAGPVTVESAGVLDYEIQYTQANSGSYQTGVIPVDSDGLIGDEVKTPFVTVFDPPATPSLSAIPISEAGYVEAIITNGAGGSTLASNDLLRRVQGSGSEWMRIATGLPANATYLDYTACSGVVYEYMARAVGANGVTADSNKPICVIAITGLWLHDVLDPQGTSLRLSKVTARGESWRPEGTLVKLAGRDLPVAVFGTPAEQGGQWDALITATEGTYGRVDATFAELDALVKRRGTLCCRDSSGRRIFGVAMQGLAVRDETWGGRRVTITVDAVAYSEEV